MVLWNQQTQWINTLFFFKVGKVVGQKNLRRQFTSIKQAEIFLVELMYLENQLAVVMNCE